MEPVLMAPSKCIHASASSSRSRATTRAAPSVLQNWSRGGVAGTTTWNRHGGVPRRSRTAARSSALMSVWLATTRYRRMGLPPHHHVPPRDPEVDVVPTVRLTAYRAKRYEDGDYEAASASRS